MEETTHTIPPTPQTETQEQPVQPQQQEQQEKKEQKLVNVEISNENVALNVMVSFLSLAQKRGAFTIDEAAKIWECISKFNPNK
jgi:hypothetical protein